MLSFLLSASALFEVVVVVVVVVVEVVVVVVVEDVVVVVGADPLAESLVEEVAEAQQRF